MGIWVEGPNGCDVQDGAFWAIQYGEFTPYEKGVERIVATCKIV